MQTDLEVFRLTVQHERPERLLYHAGFVGDLHARLVTHIGTPEIAKHYGFFSPASPGPGRKPGYQAPDYTPYWADESLPEGTQIDGAGVAMVPSGFYHFFGYVSPLRNAQSLAEIEAYPLDDPDQWDFSGLPQAVADAHAAGQVVQIFVGHIYETAWQIRGYEQFLIDMMERPAWADCLLTRLAERNHIIATAYAKAGADLFHCGDDVASQNALMFQPDQWRHLMLPKWRKIWQDVKAIDSEAIVWYHSDGNVQEIVPDLVEAGIDILNPLQPECLDIDAIHRRFGKRLTFDGMIGTQSTMPFGSADDVRARVRHVIDAYGQDGGIIISPTHVLEPEVPLANIDALAEACRTYGRRGAE